MMTKARKKPEKSERSEKPDAALCDYELEARCENERLARRKRDIESSRPPKH